MHDLGSSFEMKGYDDRPIFNCFRIRYKGSAFSGISDFTAMGL